MYRLLYFTFFSLLLLLSTYSAFSQSHEDSVLLAQAKDLIQRSNYTQARALYSFYLRFHPDNIHALSQRAVAHASLGDFERAYQDIENAFDIAGFSAIDQAVIHNNRGQVYFLEGNINQALEDFSRAIELNPSFADYWLNRGILYQILQEWDNALSDYETFLSLSPDESEVYLNMARIHLELGDLDATISGLDSAIQLSPTDPELYIFRGSVNLLRGTFDLAAMDYRDWLYLINIETLEQTPLESDTNTLKLEMGYGIIHRIPFTANKGDRLGVIAKSVTVDSLIVLLSPDGQPIMADDDSGSGLDAFFVDFLLPDSGQYTLLVGHARGGWNGEIELTLQIASDEDI